MSSFDRLQMAERLATVGALASGVAHEINNPLAYVVSNLRFIAEEAEKLQARISDPEAASRLREIIEAVTDAEQGATRVQKIVRDLRTFAGTSTPADSTLDVQAVLDAALNLFAHELRPRARLARDYREVPAVRGSEAQLGQVFLNLLINALQALPERAPDRNEIRVTTSTDARGCAVVELADNGEGIPAAALPHIFDHVYAIVLAMGGEFAAFSEPGKGSHFRVTLPAARE